jgi:putative glycosyltransferase (TIGR04348 family)
MLIHIVTPAPRGSRQGNRITAARWAGLLRQLEHRVVLRETYDGMACDLLIGLHARKSHDSIARFHRRFPQRPLIVGLAGTDLYHDIHRFVSAHRSLEMATRLVVLQAQGVQELPRELRPKARVIYQSVEPPAHLPAPLRDVFEVCVLGHLRSVKDPFRAAAAVRLLPPTSRVQITHIGVALSESLRHRALKTQAATPRYRWLGDVPRWKALRLLARSRLLVLTSKMEGGANVVSEALAVGVPVISSRIGGTIGLLGEDYPGYFPVGDTGALAALLHRAETDEDFLQELRSCCAEKSRLVQPAVERESWRALLREVATH